MSIINMNDTELTALRNKVIIVTGGASGIGEACVRLADYYNARVICADIQQHVGQTLASSLNNTTFIHCDVSSWSSQRNLFSTVVKSFGRLDLVLANAGIVEKPGVFQDVFDKDEELQMPDLSVIDVNLNGVIYSAKLALHYFRLQRLQAKAEEIKPALVITGSAASYLDSPPLWTYCPAKHGVLGLMRSLRPIAVQNGFTVNMVAPWMTDTPIGADFILHQWQKAGFPVNDTIVVARALLLPGVREMNGKSLWVGGNRIIELEDALHRCQALWMTAEMAEQVDKGQEFLCKL